MKVEGNIMLQDRALTSLTWPMSKLCGSCTLNYVTHMSLKYNTKFTTSAFLDCIILKKKSNPIFEDLRQYIDNLGVAYFFGPPCIFCICDVFVRVCERFV